MDKEQHKENVHEKTHCFRVRDTRRRHLFGRLFAAIYNRNLNTAIPRLITELNTLQQ